MKEMYLRKEREKVTSDKGKKIYINIIISSVNNNECDILLSIIAQ